MRFLSVCSGIEAASAAWEPLGWKALAFSEIEAFPRSVLAHRYPETPIHGDFTVLREQPWIVDADALVGGTPCQAFSVAGLRQSLSDDRGNLSLEFIRLANAIDDLRRAAGRPPAWVIWENVPGVLSVSDNAFGAFLGGLVGSDGPIIPDGRWADAGVVAGPQRVAAWRVLDAQFFGVAQRRRRVFVLALGGAGAWRCADALLPIIKSLSGNPAPRREAGKAAPAIPSRSSAGGGLGTDFDCDGGLIPVAHTLKGEGFDASEDGTGRGTPIVPVAFAHQAGGTQTTLGYDPEAGTAPTLGSCQAPAICFSAKDHGADAMIDLSPTLRAGGHSKSHANAGVMPAIAFALRGRDGGAMPEIEGDGDRIGALRAASGGSSRDYVAFGITRDALDRSGEGSNQTPGERSGLGIIEEQAQCLKAKGPGAVAYAVRTNQTGQNGPGYMADLSPSLSSDESVPAVARTIETMYGVSHADASQTGPHQALRTMFEAAGEEAATEWCLGVLAAFWPAEVLRPEVHGRGVRCSAIPKRGLVNVALSRSQAGAVWSVQDLWEAGRDGRAPQGWRPHEQRASELGSYLSELPYSPSPAQRLLHDMWGASEGAGLLREALSALQEARRSACGEAQSAHAGSAVRRLTVEECEALQGFPRSYTAVPHRGKPAADGPRYKSLGNSMAVPCMAWLGRRIQAVEDLAKTLPANDGAALKQTGEAA